MGLFWIRLLWKFVFRFCFVIISFLCDKCPPKRLIAAALWVAFTVSTNHVQVIWFLCLSWIFSVSLVVLFVFGCRDVSIWFSRNPQATPGVIWPNRLCGTMGGSANSLFFASCSAEALKTALVMLHKDGVISSAHVLFYVH